MKEPMIRTKGYKGWLHFRYYIVSIAYRDNSVNAIAKEGKGLFVHPMDVIIDISYYII